MDSPSEWSEAELLGRLSRERARAEFRAWVLESFLLYLFTYELPIDRVRTLVDKVTTDALAEFRVLECSGPRREICRELCERLLLVEASTVENLSSTEDS